ncbi:hypothetical protein GGE12_005136 [Rhizobium mongolense]|uniref:Uncharacterized protein n=1 Tax=Rhizobium mongolense TaxID=57676 RepID=A0A7W6RRK6_9HYPH|nr:hypothetical protein [Rhizobium mongolense]
MKSVPRKSELALTAPTATVVVPGEVRTYVIEQQTPSVTFEGDVAIGTALPDTVEIHTIPDQPDYGYDRQQKARAHQSEDPRGDLGRRIT